jgi:hypothetical protein
MDAERLRGKRHLTDCLDSSWFRCERCRNLQQFRPVAGGDGQLKAGK